MSKKELSKIFKERLRHKSAAGLDRVRPSDFEKNLDYHSSEIIKKYKDQTYRFTPYKELLILKSRHKLPRVVSIPTVRDKLILSWILKKIQKKFLLSNKFVYQIIEEIASHINSNFVYFTKLDISGFYDNINHQLLFVDLKKKIRDQKTLSIIKKAIENPTAAVNHKPEDPFNYKGVPQGIPLSNILADYFATNRIDIESSEEAIYIRFVDDILILGKNEKILSKTNRLIEKKIRSAGLMLNSDKQSTGHISSGLDFLGYSFRQNKSNSLSIRARNSSYKKHYLSLMKVFSAAKYLKEKKLFNSQRKKRFIWDLNLKITGGIFKNKRYGWLFFFSQIDENSEQIYALDRFVDKKLKDLGLNRTDLKIKRYSRTIKEIRTNLTNTRYVPKFDEYDLNDKKKFLLQVEGLRPEVIKKMSDDQVDYLFSKKLHKKIDPLEEDVGSVS